MICYKAKYSLKAYEHHVILPGFNNNKLDLPATQRVAVFYTELFGRQPSVTTRSITSQVQCVNQHKSSAVKCMITRNILFLNSEHVAE